MKFHTINALNFLWATHSASKPRDAPKSFPPNGNGPMVPMSGLTPVPLAGRLAQTRNYPTRNEFLQLQPKEWFVTTVLFLLF